MTQATQFEFRAKGAAASLFRSNADEVLICGPAGTGKTRAALEKINWFCDAHPGVRVLVCRETRVSLTESVLVTWENKVLWQGHPALKGDASRANRHSYRYDNGSEVIVGGLDNPDRIMSTEYDMIYVAEATETREEAWEKLLTRLRNDKGPYHQAIADCNPAAPQHWLNQRAIRGQMIRLLSLHKDNPSCTEEYLGRLAQLSGHRRARLFEGKWVAAEGSVFGDSFLASRNQCRPFPIPRNWPIWIRIDPGVDHPCGVSWLTIGMNGTVFCIHAISEKGKYASDTAMLIHAQNQKMGWVPFAVYLDPRHGWAKTFQSQKVIADQFEEMGLHCIPWLKLQMSGKDAAVEETAKSMRAGRLVFFEGDADPAVNEVQSWQYKRNASGEQIVGDDQYENKNNDILDGLMSFMVEGHTFEEGQPPAEEPKPFNPDDF